MNTGPNPLTIGERDAFYLAALIDDLHHNRHAPIHIKHLYWNKYYVCCEVIETGRLQWPKESDYLGGTLCRINDFLFFLETPLDSFEVGMRIEGIVTFYRLKPEPIPAFQLVGAMPEFEIKNIVPHPGFLIDISTMTASNASILSLLELQKLGAM